MIPTQIDIEGHDQPERVCACGCKRSLNGMRRDAVWYSRACAVRWARSNPGKSLLDAHSANGGRTRRRSGPSGRQVSYRKAVATLADWLNVLPTDDSTLHAEEILRPALPARQRARLEQKNVIVEASR